MLLTIRTFPHATSRTRHKPPRKANAEKSRYSELTKIRTRRRAADSTDSTEPTHLVLQHLRESFSLS
ncbi:hypothetical protein [Neisseria meningitidis]|uniref:hypothetical protein n=1 Tax=Neisseria meningitidis TaxID=487 RepID=UPI0009AB44CF|nr:hypothetical protein [Neisseria meningitidis]